MQTPREGARRYSRQERNEQADLKKPGGETPDASSPAEPFPTEPFPCPACGQMLAASCRICVACRQAIHPAEIATPPAAAVSAAPAQVEEARPVPVRYPWRIFFAVLGACLVLAQVSLAVWEEQKAALVLQTIPILVGIWVFSDALRHRIPRPFRWGVWTMLLLVFIFPWYLARRRLPQSPCPFEAEVRPFVRFLLFALIAFFLLSAILYFMQRSAPH
jgi:hypothetical protein